MYVLVFDFTFDFFLLHFCFMLDKKNKIKVHKFICLTHK